MKRISITICTVLISISLFAKSGKIILSGKVQNHSATSIMITHLNNQKLVSAELDENGNFSMSANIEKGYYFLTYGRNTSYIYLYPKDELKVDFDAKYFEKTLVFSGQGSARNNYLVKKRRAGSELTKDLEAFYKVDEATYLKNIANVKNTHLASLPTFKLKPFFTSAEKKSLEYERLLNIQNYTSNYKFYLGDDISPSDKFYEPIRNLKLDYKNDYKKQPYFRYLANSIWNKRIDNASGTDEMLAVLRKVPLQELAISLVNGFFSKMSSNQGKAKEYLELIKRITKHKPFIEAAEKRYQDVLKSNGLNKGDASPEFSYESVDGKMISLSDLKGKYVYIDVWATWCGPCIKQIPYLRKLEERYHNKNIVFVSISVDKEEVKSTWKQMVADKKLGGLQLFADKSFDSTFMDAYSVNSIPRFILIAPNGKIINPKAPRPSFDKTRVLLDALLK